MEQLSFISKYFYLGWIIFNYHNYFLLSPSYVETPVFNWGLSVILNAHQNCRSQSPYTWQPYHYALASYALLISFCHKKFAHENIRIYRDHLFYEKTLLFRQNVLFPPGLQKRIVPPITRNKYFKPSYHLNWQK